MVKLASARQSRMYGPRQGRSRAEYMNAGLYVFATIMLVSGFAAQLSKEPKSGPRKKRVNGYFKLEKQALNMLIAGPVLWVLGSIHKSFQIYERADGHLQILQQSVHIPFLMGPEPVVPCGCNYQLQREDWINPSRLGVIGTLRQVLGLSFLRPLAFLKLLRWANILVAPIHQSRPTKLSFQFVIEKIEAKLAGWKSKHLSLAGRVSLIKSVIETIPSHIMAVIVPRLRVAPGPPPPGGTGTGPLRSKILGPLQRQESSLKVKECWSNPSCNLQAISFVFPEEILSRIHVVPFQGFNPSPDCTIWNRSTNGEFNCKSAHSLIPSKNVSSSLSWDWIWRLPCSSRIQHFVWLAAHDRLATRKNLFLRNIPPSPFCEWCPDIPETTYHVLCDCPRASNIWSALQFSLLDSQALPLIGFV
ncbi:hypothetical protein RHSIM_Rhsim02G0197500 [Rhododendron simsii]|uniref:Reverse transcriptase zinc-binding domain-containing protein n=1 Tax=Rhododendron simsii TaxID=118357 RepID=A0A834HGE9_RHOSS|nr:hypothetical protein RHSIM_Rhsim02G0197500 [Rhododendron simsii]